MSLSLVRNRPGDYCDGRGGGRLRSLVRGAWIFLQFWKNRKISKGRKFNSSKTGVNKVLLKYLSVFLYPGSQTF